MEVVKEIVSLISAIFIFLGSDCINQCDRHREIPRCLLRSHASTKSATLSVLLTIVGVLIYFVVNTGFSVLDYYYH